MSVADAIPKDELVLAHVACLKLAEAMHTTMTQSPGFLHWDRAAHYLRDKIDLFSRRLTDLQRIQAFPGRSHQLEPVRVLTLELSELLKRFLRAFMDLARIHSEGGPKVREAADVLLTVHFDYYLAVAELGRVLGREPELSLRLQEGRSRLEYYLRTANQAAAARSNA